MMSKGPMSALVMVALLAPLGSFAGLTAEEGLLGLSNLDIWV